MTSIHPPIFKSWGGAGVSLHNDQQIFNAFLGEKFFLRGQILNLNPIRIKKLLIR